MHHPNTENLGKGDKYAQYWKGYKEKSLEDLAKLITQFACSNCLWSHGRRNKNHFVGADWMGLDFDDGLKLSDSLAIFEKYTHIIGITKSHGLAKKGKITDRFRVFLKFEKSCFNLKDYEYTVKKWVHKYGADKVCFDAARFFWPCREIVSINENGLKIPILNSSNAEIRKQTYINRKKAAIDHYKGSKDIPPWIMNVFRFGCAMGRRNMISYGIAKDLLRIGFSDTEVVQMISRSAIPSCGDDSFDLKEIENTVASASRSVT